MKKKKARIVKDRWSGYEVQVRRWYGIWEQPISNTHKTVEDAEKWWDIYKNQSNIIKYLD